MHAPLTIRSARPDDLGAVDALLARAYPRLLKPDYPPSVMVTAIPLIARGRPELLGSGTYYLAEVSGRVVGAAGWTPRREAGHGEVRHVVVDPDHARRGIGRALFAHLFDTAGARGVHRFSCLATRTAVPFYRALGFRPTGQVEVPLDRGITFPAIRMRRG